MTATERRPLVSFVIIARNDDYMGDYRYRLGTSVSFLAESAAAAGLGDDLEVLIVDWASERPLANDLPLNASARRITSFIPVTTDVVVARYGEPRWLPTVAVNVGVRRAAGEFIFFTDSDCLWTQPAMAALGRLLRGEIPLLAPIDELLCYVRRYQIPWATVSRQPRLGEWRRTAELLAAGLHPESASASSLGGFSAGQLMHRDIWFAVRGYDEALDRPWGWSDNDLMLRVSQQYPWLDVSAHGFFGLHMEHWPRPADRLQRDPDTVNPMRIRDTMTVNDDDWGLGGVVIAPVHSSCASEIPAGRGYAVSPGNGESSDAEVAELLRQLAHERSWPPLSDADLATVARGAVSIRPQRIAWIGSIVPPALQAMLLASPAAELVLINPWPAGVSDQLPFHPGEFARFIQAHCRYKGWARIVQGPAATAWQRVDDGSLDAGPFEMAWLDDAAPAAMADGLRVRMAAGGVLFQRGAAGVTAIRAPFED